MSKELRIVVSLVVLGGILGIVRGNFPFNTPAAASDRSTTPAPAVSALNPGGPWEAQVGDLKLIFNSIEVLQVSEGGRHLRLHATVENDTDNTVTLALSSFIAVDNRGGSYTAPWFGTEIPPDVRKEMEKLFRSGPVANNWPQSFPAGMRMSGWIDLIESVPEDVSTLSAGFTHFFPGMSSIIVRDIVLPSAEPTSSPSYTSPQVPSSVGPWETQVDGVKLIIDRIEVLQDTGKGRLLRLHTTVDNRTSDAIRLPLFGRFVAVDNQGRASKADPFASAWPKTFPAGMQVAGSIDLAELVPNDASSLDISFTTIFGSLSLVGDSLTIKGIILPAVETDSHADEAQVVDEILASGQVGQLEIFVTGVEISQTNGSDRMVRLHLLVDNRTSDAIKLPLFGYFVAVDNQGRTYKAKHFDSAWPQTFPAGMRITGSIDLAEPLPADVSTLTTSFTQVFGTLSITGGIKIERIPVS